MLYAVTFYENTLEGPIDWPKQVIEFSDEFVNDYKGSFSIFTEKELEIYKKEKEKDYENWHSFLKKPTYVKIYKFIENSQSHNTTKPPLSVNFITGILIKLHRKSILVKGECVREEYYENCISGVFSNLILKEVHQFTRDALGFPIKRNSKVVWINFDESENEITKSIDKYYSALEKIDEGKKRRGNLVDGIQMPCIGLISIAMTGSPNPTNAVILEGRKFLYEYKKQFDTFVDESNREIIHCFSNPANENYASVAKYPWIDSMTPYRVTIRQYLISELTI